MNAELTREQIEAIQRGWTGTPAFKDDLTALCDMALAHLRSQPKGYVSVPRELLERCLKPVGARCRTLAIDDNTREYRETDALRAELRELLAASPPAGEGADK